MGMSAGQARLLSITGRLTDNELRSQIITNSKLRLADKSSRASQEYMDALNSTKLMYGAYNDKAEKNYTALTANTLLTYGDLKNQYSLVNSSGQIMAAGSDIKKYEAASTLNEYLYSYDIAKVDNPKYAEQLKNIYGNDVDDLFDEAAYESRDTTKAYTGYTDTITGITDTGIQSIKNILNKDTKTLTTTDADNIAKTVSNWSTDINNISQIQSVGGNKYLGGTFGTYINTVLNPPDIKFPNMDDYKSDEGTKLAKDFDIASKPCYKNAMGGVDGCYIHVLAHLLDLKSSDLTSTDDNDGKPTVYSGWGTTYTTTLGRGTVKTNEREISGSAIQNNGLATSMAPISEYLCFGVDKNGKQTYEDAVLAPDKGNPVTNSTADVDKLLSNYKLDSDGTTNIRKTFKEKIIDLYYVVEHYSDADMKKNDGTNYTYDDLKPYLADFQQDMMDTLNTVTEEYWEAIDDWKNQMLSWVNSIETVKNQYIDSLSKIPEKKIPDKNDAKYQWYVNLWYRMGGTSETTKQNNKNNYKELDENLINNSEWLEFALEHGILTMEQAQFSENGSKTYPGMGTYDWNSIIYTNSNDITSQQDDTAIAIAEVKYKNKITEIENQDKKFDQDLKKLDSEHNALQTEYDSVKSVIDKNVERSFKAFS